MTPKNFLITGCSTGLGRAIAEAAIHAGHRVIATARDIRSIADLEEARVCRVLTLDVTDPTNIRETISEAGAIDGHARAHSQARIETRREFKRDATQALTVAHLSDAGDALNDAGKHALPIDFAVRRRADLVDR